MKPGPRKGHGGAPRKRNPASNKGGYQLTTVGPKSRGTRQYAHRVIAHGGSVGGTKRAPKSSKGTRSVVDHRNRNRSDNRSSNLRRVSRSTNNRNR